MFGDDFDDSGEINWRKPQTRCVTVTPLWLLSGYLYDGVTLVRVVELSSQLDNRYGYLHLQ